MPMKKEYIVVRGLIIPAGWDEKGNVVTISLSSFDEDEYIIDKDEMGTQLLSLLRSKAELSGVLREEKGIKKITVKTYHAI